MSDPQPRRPMMIAHRYGNDLALLAAAVAAGADYVETDIRPYRGRLDVRHAKTLGPLPIIWDRWYVRRYPRDPLDLDTVLNALPKGMGIMLDLKGNDPVLPELLLAALRRHPDPHPIMISSRFWDYLPSLRDYPGLMLFHSIGTRGQLERVRPLLDLRENDAVCVKYTLLDGPTVASLKQQVSMVSTWGINDTERLRHAIDWGVDAIITDEEPIMRQAAARTATP